MVLSELAERCEQAAGPDRRVDAAICREVELPLCFEPDCLPDVMVKIIDRVERGEWDQDPDVSFYTSSLDAAMKLVPGGCLFDLQTSFEGAAMALVAQSSVVQWRGHGATPALALCAAALRARAASADTHPKGQDAEERLGS